MHAKDGEKKTLEIKTSAALFILNWTQTIEIQIHLLTGETPEFCTRQVTIFHDPKTKNHKIKKLPSYSNQDQQRPIHEWILIPIRVLSHSKFFWGHYPTVRTLKTLMTSETLSNPTHQNVSF
ncbi:hypothetical protein CIPAW_16G090600 [Carya illinoinensis]|uniref:Uncharacterized protein n=1 Tax=Carya illinoinensis TaxID=32201 RepID=A0A8T1N666_CARIL|nr:hypothetical protein CIPAW_16G090600 [Carya illinoinensis]